MNTLKKTIYIALIAGLLLKLVMPVFFVSTSEASITALDSPRHQVVITADVCSKKPSGSINVLFFPIRPACTMLITVLVTVLPIIKNSFFLPITTNQFFHPPKTR